MNAKQAQIAALTALAAFLPQAAAASVNAALAKDPAAFVAQPAAQPRLNQLLGPINARFFRKNFEVVSTLQLDGKAAVVTGCRAHDCPLYGALVAYDRRHDAFKVWLTVNGKTRVFTEKGWNVALGPDARATLENLN